MRKALTTLIAIGISGHCYAAHLHPEKYYQEQWCKEQGGQTEVVFSDKTRADCVTKTHAVEVDFAGKWAEAVGQSLHYSRMTGKRAGILLIIENQDELRHLDKLRPIADQQNITIWFAG